MRRNCDNTVVVPSYNVDTGGVLVKSIISCTTRLFLQFLWCDEWTFISTIYTNSHTVPMPPLPMLLNLFKRRILVKKLIIEAILK